MRADLQQRAEAMQRRHTKKRRWTRVVTILAAIVVFCTSYALILPAITAENQTYCGAEAHEHDVSCYTRTLVCGYPEEGETQPTTEIQQVVVDEGHAHDDSCYDEEGTLICGETERDPVLEEREVAVAAEPAHVHTDACYEDVLTCGKEEHEHDDTCFSNPKADVESASVWEATLPKELTGDWAKDVLAIAESQLGYAESQKNYQVVNGRNKGYSRYGAWYGDPYGDWCAMFAAFCLHYADVPETAMPRDAYVPTWAEQAAKKENYLAPSEYAPEPGDIIFFDWDRDGTLDHVGLVKETTEAGQVVTIEGNSSDAVRRQTYDETDPRIAGYAALPEKPAETAAAPETTYAYPVGTVFAEVTVDADGNLVDAETGDVIGTASEGAEEGTTYHNVTVGEDGSLVIEDGSVIGLVLPAAVTPRRGAPSRAPAAGATIKSSGVLDESDSSGKFSAVPGQGTVTWEIYTDGTLVIRPTDGVSGAFNSAASTPSGYGSDTRSRDWPWSDFSVGYSIRKIEVQSGVNAYGSLNSMFSAYESSIDLSGLNTSHVTDMSHLFDYCVNLTSLDFSMLDTSNVTDMSYMFKNCEKLTSLDLSSLDTSNVTKMSGMFQVCSGLTELDLSPLNTSKVTSMRYMFGACRGLTNLDLSPLDTSKVTDMYFMFGGCTGLTSLDLSPLDTSKVTDMDYMFYGCTGLTSLDLSPLDTRNVTKMNNMFSGCSGLTSLDLSPLDTSKVTGMAAMFSGCSGLTSLDLSPLDTSKVTSLSYMFNGCTGLTELDVSHFDTSKVTGSMTCMFKDCRNLSKLDGLENWDVSKVTGMNEMFQDCRALTSLDLSSWNTASVRNGYLNGAYNSLYGLGGMFANCISLTDLDVSGWNVSNVTDMSYVFANCTSLTSLDLSSWDVSKALIMRGTFYNCASLSELDVHNWSTPAALTMDSMFAFDYNLEHLDISGFDTTNVGESGKQMFHLSPVKTLTVGPKFKFASEALDPNDYWYPIGDPDTLYTGTQLRDAYNADPATMAGTYVRIPEDEMRQTDPDPLYRGLGLGDQNLWEVHSPEYKFRGFCINLRRHAPDGYYDRVVVNRTGENSPETFLDPIGSSNYGWAPLGSDMYEALITLVYFNADQETIWDFTNRYPTDGSYPVRAATFGHTYADIPEEIRNNLTLYLYISRDGNQNMLSLEGLQNEPKGGVQIYKTDGNNKPLSGAEFTIYDSTGAVVRTITTNQYGLAGIYLLDDLSTQGLPLGSYTVKETKAPAGYDGTNDVFAFTLTEDQQVVTIGYRNGSETGERISFVNEMDEDWKGGGVGVIKIDWDNEVLEGAEFTIFDENGDPVTTIVTNGMGRASTGERELPLGSYTIRETKPPKGYKLSDEVKSFTITEDDENKIAYTFTFENEAKRGSAKIEVQKLVPDDSGVKLRQMFRLYRQNPTTGEYPSYGTSVWSDATTGKATFTLNYTASDLQAGYYTYKIVEIAGSDSTVEYDTHEEYVTVIIYDPSTLSEAELERLNFDGDYDKLITEVIYDDDGAVFRNMPTTAGNTLSVQKVWRSADGAQISDSALSATVQLQRRPASDTNAAWENVTGELVTLNSANLYAHIWTGLDGDYVYRVQETPVRGFTVVYSGNNETGTINDDITVTNIAGRMRLHKVDQDDQPLSGVTFTIYADDNGTMVETPSLLTLTTDRQGYAYADLTPGTYWFKETVPENYSGPTGPIQFVVNDDCTITIVTQDEAVTSAADVVTVVNTQIKEYELPKTGGPGTALFYALGTALVLAAAGLLTRRCKGKRLLAVLCCIMMVITLAPAAQAAEVDLTKPTSLTLLCTDSGAPLEGVRFTVYRVAGLTQDLRAKPVGPFADYAVSFDTQSASERSELAETLSAYAARDQITPDASAVTDASGSVSFKDLSSGLYLVTAGKVRTETTEYTIDAMLLSLPGQTDSGAWEYDVTARPKLSGEPIPTGTVELQVMKVWKNDGGTAKRPEKIEIELLCDGQVYDTVTLRAENQWRHAWTGLEAGKVWQVAEKRVPTGYTVRVGREGTAFVVTNTAKTDTPTPGTPGGGSGGGGGRLPQTGMLWWPVPVLAVLGMGLFLTGWIRRGRSDAE